MRLTCPSCGAQYEVDDSVIPEAGRDVQCSNCGHAWFQVSASQLKAEAERAAETPQAAPDVAVAWTADEDASQQDAASPEMSAEVSAAVDAGADSAALPAEAPEPAEEPEPEPAAEASPEPQWKSRRKTLDDAVMNVLREEADRELRVRAAEGSLSATQPDPSPAVTAAVATMVAAQPEEPERPQAFSVDEDDDAIVSRASRRELLPDIEEINSTLRATSDRGGEAASVDAPETLRRRRSGFRMGFSTSLLIAALLLLLYVMAPVIADKVPASAPAMTAYVGVIDSARAWLDATLRGLTASMKGDGG